MFIKLACTTGQISQVRILLNNWDSNDLTIRKAVAIIKSGRIEFAFAVTIPDSDPNLVKETDPEPKWSWRNIYRYAGSDVDLKKFPFEIVNVSNFEAEKFVSATGPTSSAMITVQ